MPDRRSAKTECEEQIALLVEGDSPPGKVRTDGDENPTRGGVDALETGLRPHPENVTAARDAIEVGDLKRAHRVERSRIELHEDWSGSPDRSVVTQIFPVRDSLHS